jgi:CDP-diglyceride synthetase
VIAWQLLGLVIVANGAALAGHILCGRFGAWPLDFGLTLADGQRLFGDHKTIRGVLLAVIFTAIGALLLGLPAATGIIIALAAMAGDAAASLVKRRLGIAPGGMAIGLDQLPESLLPLFIVGPARGLSWTTILGLGLAFLAFELAASRLLYRLHLRNHPY